MVPRLWFLALINIFITASLPSYAQPFDFDYSMMVPFRATSSTGPIKELVIESIYRNPNNRDTSRVRNGLPPVSTDSFVYEAGGMAELIYGDESRDSIPPYFDFTPEHRIEAGISGRRAHGLTVGKSSPLPTTWGGDEFYRPEPFQSHGQEFMSSPPLQIPLDWLLPESSQISNNREKQVNHR